MLLAQFMPEGASTFADDVDFAFWFVTVISAFFFALIAGLMFYFCIRYRRREPGQKAQTNLTHNTALEITWTIIPTLLVGAMFWIGFRTFVNMRQPPANTYNIHVNAFQWGWGFIYPNGHNDENLNIPANVPVRLIMRSQDVIHSLFIPAFRAKHDVVPGRLSEMWFQATKPGEYPLFCAEYCGTNHSNMSRLVIVHENMDEFQTWLKNADPYNKLTDDQYKMYLGDFEKFQSEFPDAAKGVVAPIEYGKELFRKRGCRQCHSEAPGGPDTCPPLYGIVGERVEFIDGSSTVVDENYLFQSIMNPGSQIVKGYGNNMPADAVTKEREAEILVRYIKSLSKSESGE